MVQWLALWTLNPATWVRLPVGPLIGYSSVTTLLIYMSLQRLFYERGEKKSDDRAREEHLVLRS